MTNKALFCQLGRAGDVLNALPLAKRYFDQTGVKPYFQTATAYASILDGVSYVEPVIYPGEFTSGILALYQARQLTSDVRVCQIYGFGLNPPQDCTSFARQSWVSAGADVPWGLLPLVIDQRNDDREVQLAYDWIVPALGRKVVLVALNGQSSPFPYRGLVMQCLKDRLGDEFHVIDLCQIKAERFYDLLGLFDVAHCLVTVDTGHLHLAHASKVPVVSFVTRDPSPWHGSPWRPNHVGRYYYDEVRDKMDDILDDIVTANAPFCRPQIIHTWSDWREGEPDIELRKRAHVAQSSWLPEYATGYWIPAEHLRTPTTRTGKDIGDPHPIAYAKDTIENGIKLATKDSDIICLTNADIGFSPGLTGHILEVVARKGAAFSHRRDFDKIDVPFLSESQVRKGRWYPGSDLFCFTVGWWKAHKAEYPDYLLGREFWDEALRQLIKYHGGGDLQACAWHCWHESFWCGDLRDKLPGNIHNKKLILEWFKETGFTHEDFRYFRTGEDSHLHPHPQPPRKIIPWLNAP